MIHLLPYLRGVLHNDCTLFIKLIRIGDYHLKSSNRNADVERYWLRFTRHLFLSSLSNVDCNTGVSNELWVFLKNFSYQTRFGLYGSWKRGFREIALAPYSKAKAIDQTKRVMRRISKDNLKQFGRILGKICHSNSVHGITVILDQLQAYENLIPHAVDAMRFLTEFDMDVLSFVMVESLSNPEKSRLKDDGTNISAWLLNLSDFCGTVYHKYIGLDLSSILHYIYCQMFDRNIFDLAVLKGLVQKMSGIASLDSLSDAQIDALVAGEHYRNEVTLYFSSRFLSNCLMLVFVRLRSD